MFCSEPGLEVVDADHPVPLAEQVLAEVGAEEAGAAGDHAGAHRALMLSAGPRGTAARSRFLQFADYVPGNPSRRGENSPPSQHWLGMFGRRI